MIQYKEIVCDLQSTQEEQNEAKIANDQKAASFCKCFLLPSILYAIVFSICTYKNYDGITVLIWIGATLAFCKYTITHLEAQKKLPLFYCITMFLLGISTIITGNEIILFLNYSGFFLLLISMLLHVLFNDSSWDPNLFVVNIIHSCVGAISCIFRPISDYIALNKQNNTDTERRKVIQAILFGLLTATPVLLIVLVCLASADMVFCNLLGDFFSGLASLTTIFNILIFTLFGFFSCYCGIRFLTLGKIKEDPYEYKKHNPISAIAFLGIIQFIYVIFCGIQVVYLFIGYGALPDNTTYAEYARSGFFQLLFIVMMNLAIVLVIKKHFAKHKVLDTLLILCCVCTYIMIASSAYRMLLYIAAYHLTFLRIFVLVALLLLFFLLTGAAIYVMKPNFPYFRYSIYTVTIIYLLLSFSHVDYFIAKYNLSFASTNTIVSQSHRDNYDVDPTMDVTYIKTLSTDAAPAIMNHINQQAKQDTELANKMSDYKNGTITLSSIDLFEETNPNIVLYFGYQKRNDESLSMNGIRHLNLSRYIAKKCI